MEKFTNKFNDTIIKIRFYLNENKLGDDGIGVVEVILILLVLVGLVLIFKGQITAISKSIFSDISDQVDSI